MPAVGPEFSLESCSLFWPSVGKDEAQGCFADVLDGVSSSNSTIPPTSTIFRWRKR